MPTEDYTNRADFGEAVDRSGMAIEPLADSETDKLQTGPEVGSLTNGLVAYYPFENTTNSIVRDGALDNDGVDNTSAGYVEGAVGSLAKDFDGVDDNIPLGRVLDDGSTCTISAFIKKTDADTDVDIVGTGAGQNTISYERLGSNGFEYVIYNGSQLNITSGITSQDVWHHFAATYDGNGTYKFYANGSVVGSITGESDWGTDSFTEGIGFDTFNDSRNFGGYIDDVRIYNRALSQPEIEALSELDQPSGLRFDEANEFDSLDSGIARYEFEQNVSDSFGSNDGTDNTSAGYSAGRVGDFAKDFDGSDDNVTTTGSFSEISQFQDHSVSCWMNADEAAGVSNAVIINRIDGDDRFGLTIFGGELTAGIYDNSASSYIAKNGYSNFDEINEWVHVTWTFDSSSNTGKFYFNGQEKTGSGAVISGVNNDTFSIGGGIGTNDWYDGQIDDLRIYDRALSDAEIQALASQRATDGRGNEIVPSQASSGVSRYAFEGDVTDSWGTNDGTDNTSAGFVDGVYGQAKVFDGADDRVELPDLGLGSSQPFSVSVWIKTNVSNANKSIFGRFDSSDDIIQFQQDGTNWRWRAGHTSGSSYDIRQGTVETDTWTHLVGTFDPNSPLAILYKNGSEVGRDSTSPDDFATTDGPWIGARTDGANYWDGQIDDVRIYDKALTDIEVERLYHKGAHRIDRGDVV